MKKRQGNSSSDDADRADERATATAFLWEWRERLCAEKPTKAVAIDVLSSFSFRPSFSFPFGCWENQSPSGIEPRTHRSQRREQSFLLFVVFLFRLLKSQ